MASSGASTIDALPDFDASQPVGDSSDGKDLSTGFVFGKAANVAGRFGSAKRSIFCFDNQSPKKNPSSPECHAPNKTPKDSPRSINVAPSSSPETDPIPHKSIFDQPESTASGPGEKATVAVPSNLPIVKKSLNQASSSSRDSGTGSWIPFPDANRPTPLNPTEKRYQDKSLHLSPISSAFIVTKSHKRHTASDAISPRGSPSVVGDLEMMTFVSRPRTHAATKTQKLVSKSQNVRAHSRQQQKATPHLARKDKENRVHLPLAPSSRPSSRGSNISRRRLQIPNEWFSSGDDNHQLFNVASTLNTWAEFNRHNRLEANKRIEYLENKIRCLKAELKKSSLAVENHLDVIQDIETKKSWVEGANDKLLETIKALETKIGSQQATIQESEEFEKYIQEKVASTLRAMNINEEVEGLCDKFSRIVDRFHNDSTRIAEYEIALAKAERGQQLAEQNLDIKVGELETTKSQDQAIIQSLELRLEAKSDEIVSLQCRIAELTHQTKHEESIRTRNDLINEQLSKVLKVLSKTDSRAQTKIMAQESLNDKLDAILNTVQDQSGDFDERGSAIQDYLEVIKKVCLTTQDKLVSSLTGVLSQTSEAQRADIEGDIKSVVEKEVGAISEQMRAQEARLCELFARSQIDDKLTDRLKELHDALEGANANRLDLEKKLLTQTHHLEAALKKAEEASNLQTANVALQESIILQTRHLELTEEKSKHVDTLQTQLQECLVRQSSLEAELREREKAYAEVQTALAKQKRSLAALDTAVSVTSDAGIQVSTGDSKTFRDLVDSNQCVIDLKEKLKRYECLLQDAHSILREWTTYRINVMGLQGQISNVGFTNIGIVCERLESLWKRVYACSSTPASSASQAKAHYEVGETLREPLTEASGKGSSSLVVTGEDHFLDDDTFCDVDTEDILKSMDNITSPVYQQQQLEANAVESAVMFHDDSQLDASAHSQHDKTRRIVIKSPCETNPPNAPTVEEEKLARRSAEVPISIMKTRLPKAVETSETATSSDSNQETSLRKNQLRKQTSLSVVRSAQMSLASTTLSMTTPDEIRQSLTIVQPPFSTSQSGKRSRDAATDSNDLGHGKVGKVVLTSSPGGIKSGYFSSRVKSYKFERRTSSGGGKVKVASTRAPAGERRLTRAYLKRSTSDT